MPAHELVVRAPALEMLADDVDVLEVALEDVALVDRGRAGGVVERVHDRHRKADAVGRRDPERRAQVQRERSGGGRRPHLADGLGQERAARANGRLGVADVRLHHRLVAQLLARNEGRSVAVAYLRETAARFSFLLSIPAIAASGLLELREALHKLPDGSYGGLVVATVVSGRGSNLAALLRALEDSAVAGVALVISNRADAGALAIARERGIPTHVLNDSADAAEWRRVLEAQQIELIVLAGFVIYLAMSSWVEYRLNPNFGRVPTAREKTRLLQPLRPMIV